MTYTYLRTGNGATVKLDGTPAAFGAVHLHPDERRAMTWN